MLCAGLAFTGVAACSNQGPTDRSASLGYGTPGVSAYVADGQGQTLQGQLDQCRQVPLAGADTKISGLPAACSQLRRMMVNQPGNGVAPVHSF